ncbi:MAG: DUF2135 domain-containing protein [Spirochaetaceae bacterium]|jgi:hypothetical protein|nr:DUF2135 domain-containing protein [Spirochaetaceae bacterium]
MKNLKKRTSREKFFGKMWVLPAFALIVSMFLFSCGEEPGKGGTRPAASHIIAVDVRENTNWDCLVVGEDGSSIVLKVDDSKGIPKTLFLKQDKNSDDGITFFFKDNGLPDKMVANNHIFYFGNFRDYEFDLAVITPEGEIDYYPDMQSETKFTASEGRSAEGQGRLAWSDIDWRTCLDYAGKAIGAGTCVATLAFPPAGVGCAAFIASEFGHFAADKLLDGIPQSAAHGVIDAIGCAGVIGGDIGAVLDCISYFGDVADIITAEDAATVAERAPELAQANGVINGGKGDVIVTLSWDNLADVDLHVKDPSGEEIYYSHKTSRSGGELDFDNREGYGPEHIYWPTGAAPDGTYEVYVNFYGPGSSSANNTSSNYTVLINASGYIVTHRGTVSTSNRKVLVDTFTINNTFKQGTNGTYTSSDGEKMVLYNSSVTLSSNNVEMMKGTYTTNGSNITMTFTQLKGEMFGEDAPSFGLSESQWYTRLQVETTMINYCVGIGISRADAEELVAEEMGEVLSQLYGTQTGTINGNTLTITLLGDIYTYTKS